MSEYAVLILFIQQHEVLKSYVVKVLTEYYNGMLSEIWKFLAYNNLYVNIIVVLIQARHEIYIS